MTRVKRGTVTKQRHARLLKEAKGYWGRRKNVYRRAAETVNRALAFAYKGRRLFKRDMRSLFITRLNAALAEAGIKYNVFINNMKTQHIALNRKMLSQIAVYDAPTFQEIIRVATSAN